MTSLAMITFFLPRTAVLILVFSGRDGFSLVLPIKSAFLSLVLHILRSGSADVKTLQRLSGKCISFSLAIPAARLFLNDINIALICEAASSTRINAVFDDYQKLSTKNAEREKRGAEMGNEYKSIRPDHRVQQWRRFLSNPENK